MELRNRILQRRSPSKAAAPAHTYDITPQPRRPQIEFAQLINSPLLLTAAAAAAAVPWPSRPSPTTVALLSAAVAAAAALALGRPPSAVALLLELIVMKL